MRLVTAIPAATAALAAILAFSAVSAANGQFYLVGNTPGTQGSRAYGLSADGRVATGFSEGESVPNVGFKWTVNEGRTDYFPQGGFSVSVGHAISGDGTTIVGTGLDTGGHVRAMRYTGSGAYQNLGTLGGLPSSAAYGVSGDGSVVVGDAYDNQFGISVSFRWTQAGGMRFFGTGRPGDTFLHATGVSRDGVSVVGSSGNGSTTVGYVWTQAAGMHVLQGLDGSTIAQAAAVNNIGTIVVGNYLIAGTNRARAAVWRDGLTIDLGVEAGMYASYANAVSDDGSVVAGQARMTDFSDRACVWTPSTGMTLLSTYLADNGVAFPADFVFTQCSSVSADGRTFAGTGGFSGGTTSFGYVVTIPSSSGIAVFAAAAIIYTPRRRQFQF